MAPQPIPRDIAQAAGDWILRREEGLSAADREAFDAWRGADPRHEEALARLDALWTDVGEVVVDRTVAPIRSVPTLDPRRAPIWTWALAASLLLGLFVGGEGWWIRMRADYATGIGEQRQIVLSDGSLVRLDSGSALALDYSDARRGVKLLSGRALFTVEADRSRPFVVEAGDGSATALGTQFVVERQGDHIAALVTEHRVAVQTGGHAPTVIGEGQAIDWQDDRLGQVRSVDPKADTAWVRGKLVVAGASLPEVLARIGHYRQGYVGVVGAAADLRVSGVYDIGRPDDALAAVRNSLGLREIRVTDRFIVLHR